MTAMVLLAAIGCSQQQFGVLPQNSKFSQEPHYNNKVDVLWVVDNSNSMLQHQQKIADQVSGFINALKSTGMDFHMGVTTMDVSSTGEKGRLLATPLGSPTVLKNSTPNMLSILQQRLQMGDGGSSVERALEATKLALTEPLASGYNSGFRRLKSDRTEGAVLAVIYLTNEDDESGSAVPDPVDFFNKNSVISNYSGLPQWVVSFVGTIPDDPSCSTVPWTKEDGLAFINLANKSGGGISSICNDNFAEAIANIQGRILSVLTEYYFRKDPLVSSIKVYIDGVQIPNDPTNGWTYFDTPKPRIRFNGTAIPPIGSNIVVDFLPEEL